MNFFKLKLMGAALCFTLLNTAAFAQTNVNDTESPDTSWFTDVTDKVGLGNLQNPGGTMWVDVNNDNYPDLIVLNGLGVDNGWQLFINEQRPGSNDPTDRVFVDATANSGLNVPGVYKDLAGIGDFDNDGNIDIVINCWPLDNMTSCPTIDNPAKEKCRIFWGNGDGTFTIDSAKYPGVPTGLEQLGNLSGSGLPALDYDRDGNLDLFVACHYDSWCQQDPQPSHLMHNNGDHTFSDSTTVSGINVSEIDSSKLWRNYGLPHARALFGANMSDWNNDCWPDIFTCPYEAIGYPDSVPGGSHYYVNYCGGLDNGQEVFYPCYLDTFDTRGYGNLYENLGGKGKPGRFKDVGVTANYDTHFAWAQQGIVPWAAMPADYNNDGNMDYLVLEVHGANYDSASTTKYPNEPGYGRTCIFTNTGPQNGYKLRPDINRIKRSNPINQTHGDHTGCWADFNNDGWEDLTIGDAVYAGTIDNQRMFFELQDTITHDFTDITGKLGYCSGTSSIDFKIRRPGSISPVDYDLDGDDDIMKMPYSWPADSVLILRNNVGNRNNHITIKLKAPHDVNRSCIGARIRVVSGNLKQMKDIMGDQGQWTNDFPLIQNFGLGKRTMIDTIDVRWPDANCSHTIITHVAVNQFIVIDSSTNFTSAVLPVNSVVPNDFVVYPNPDAGGALNLRFTNPLNPFITIYNAIGQEVANFRPGYSYIFTLPINNLPAGLYFVHVQGTPDGTVSTKPFFKSSTF